MRTKVPAAVETELLLQSARRCCLCLGLRFDAEEKPGQIAHVDGNASNNALENLAWLCLYHHDLFDSTTSQSKGITAGELKAHRARLYELVSARRQSPVPEAESSIETDAANERALGVIHRYESVRDEQIDALREEILTRLRKVHLFNSAVAREFGRLAEREPPPPDADYTWTIDHLKRQFDFPDGVYGLSSGGGEFDANWVDELTEVVKDWTEGWLEYDWCTHLLWQLDERYDTDLHYVLYGIPNAQLSGVTYQLLISFVYQFGMRNLRDKEL